MTDALAEALESETAAAAAIVDPIERFRAVRDLRARLDSVDQSLIEIEQGVVQTLHETRSWSEVGALLGFSGSRAEAIARGR
ncbi:hypothetical protein ACIOUE_00890 [Streptomyces xanthochromogenes]|uniref:hypothetical protein n=1 Tax=Streptomyces xanthochromogenes TaxID=67384 RepID=UPI003811B82D